MSAETEPVQEMSVSHGVRSEANTSELSMEADWSDGSEQRNVFKLTDFDFCRLIEVSQKTKGQCYVCKKKRHKKVKTSFLCCNCNIPCCLKCYDYHRREKLQHAIQVFRKKNSAVKVQISKCGEFLEVNETSDHECKETSPNTLESKSVSKFDTPNEFPQLKNEDSASCSDDHETSPHRKNPSFSSVEPAIYLLKEKYKVISESMLCADGSFRCLFFQDSHMKDFFNFYSHRICMDFSFKITHLEAVVIFFIAEDSNGQSEIISVVLLTEETPENITWLTTMFKKHNPNWRNIKMLVVDSSFQNRDVIRGCFPDATFLICFHQATRTFHRDLNSNEEFSDVPDDQKKCALELFENMAHAYTEMEYSLLHQQLLSVSDSIPEYFDGFWRPLKNEWRVRIEYHEDIIHAMDKYLIFVENRIKPVLSTSSNLCSFIEKFFFVTKLLRMEMKIKMTTVQETESLSVYSKFTPQFHISKVLTSYAAEFVNHQLDISAEINISPGILLDSYVFCHFGTSVIANAATCSCKFFVLTYLPCCHIFAVRRILGLLVIDESLYDVRWTAKYYLNAHASLRESYGNSDGIDSDSKNIFKASSDIINKMLRVITSCYPFFEQKISLLKGLVCSWQKSEDVCLQFEGKEENATIDVSSIKQEPLQDDLSKEGSDDTMSSASESADEEETDTHIEELDLTNRNEDREPKPDFLTINCEFGTTIFDGKNINFLYLICVICETKETCIRWLQYMGFLPVVMPCPSCENQMQQEPATRLIDGALWVCRNDKGSKKSCGKRRSVRRGTWFERTNMSLEQILTFVYMWVHGFQQQQIMSELGIAYATYTVWEKYFRYLCMSCVENNANSSADDDDASNSSEEREWDNGWMARWNELKSDKDPFIEFLKEAEYYYKKRLSMATAME